MYCKCIKSDVCDKRPGLIKSFNAVLERRFGPIDSEPWTEFEALIQKRCAFRKEGE